MFWILPVSMGLLQVCACLAWAFSDKPGAGLTALFFGVFAVILFALTYLIHRENRKDYESLLQRRIQASRRRGWKSAG